MDGKFHKVRIYETQNMAPRGVRVELDGIEVKGVRDYEVIRHLDEPAILRLEILIEGLDVDTPTE